MACLTIEKVCMICGGTETKESSSGGSMIVNRQESICNRCKGVLRDVVMKEVGLNKDTEITFNWDQ